MITAQEKKVREDLCCAARLTTGILLADSGGLGEAGLGRGAATSSKRAGTGLLLEDLPELEGLVRGGGGEHLAVGAESRVQDTGLVGGDLDVLDKSRVAPDAQAVVGEARGRDDLLVAGAPAEGGDLAAGVDAVDASARGGVPEVDHAVVAAAAGGEEVRLPRAPGQSLDRGLVVGLLEFRGVQRTGIPDGDEVVVAAGGELGTVGAPLKTADLGGVGDELGNLVLGDANIVVEDKTGAGTSGQQVLVPTHSTNTGVVAVHGAKLGAVLDVPDLNLTRTETSSDVSTVARPLDRGDVGVFRALEEGGDGARLGRPDVDVALEADGDLVTGGPVKEVEVVVVNKTRCVENTLRRGQYTTAELRGGSRGRLQRAVVLGTEVDRARRLRSSRLELQDALLDGDTARLGDRFLVRTSVGADLVLGSIILVVILTVVQAETLKGKSGVRGRQVGTTKVESARGTSSKSGGALAGTGLGTSGSLVIARAVELDDCAGGRDGLAGGAVGHETVGGSVVDLALASLGSAVDGSSTAGTRRSVLGR
jgi:hypothetical protein